MRKYLFITLVFLSVPSYSTVTQLWGKVVGVAFNSAINRFGPIVGSGSFSGSGVNTSRPVAQQGGTISKMWVFVSANTLNDNASIGTYLKTTTAGNVKVVITTSTTGTFTDDIDTDVLSDGTTIELQLITGGSSGSMTAQGVSSQFAPTADYTTLWSASGNGISYTNGISTFSSLNGDIGGVVVEANTQYKSRTAGTLKNLQINVLSNSLSTAYSTVTIRINGANGNETISVKNSVAGVFMDTVHTDTINSGDLINVMVNTTSGGTGNLNVWGMGADLNNNVNQFEIGTTDPAGVAPGAASLRWIVLGSKMAFATPEANGQIRTPFSFTASNLRTYISASATTNSGTMKFRKGGVDGNQIITISSSTTGWFEDSIHNESLSANDLISIQFASGSGGSTVINTIEMTGTLPNSGNPRFGDMNIMGF